jgi:hypothetical protein
VIVNGVDLAKIGAHLAHFHQQARRQGSERDVSFLYIDACFTKRDKASARA